LVITPAKLGEKWPSGSCKVIAYLDVDEEWISRVFGMEPITDWEDGLGTWIGVGGVLPSGELIEVVKYTYSSDASEFGFQFRIDQQSSNQFVLEEFLKESKILHSKVSLTRFDEPEDQTGITI
jgi:hypothetical protein